MTTDSCSPEDCGGAQIHYLTLLQPFLVRGPVRQRRAEAYACPGSILASPR